MREIKFRAWFNNTMIDTMSIQEMIHQRVNTIPLKTLNNEVIFMQYTGLKDKNGVEIYEGDILQVELDWGYGPTKILSKVYFENGCFRAKALNSHEDTLLIELPPCEVISNIYENPELLEV